MACSVLELAFDKDDLPFNIQIISGTPRDIYNECLVHGKLHILTQELNVIFILFSCSKIVFRKWAWLNGCAFHLFGNSNSEMTCQPFDQIICGF